MGIIMPFLLVLVYVPCIIMLVINVYTTSCKTQSSNMEYRLDIKSTN